MKMDAKKVADFAKQNPHDDAGEEPHAHDEEGDDEEEGEEDEGEESDDEDFEIVMQVVEDLDAGKNDESLDELIQDYDPETEGNPPSWVADEALWDRAKAAVADEKDPSHEDVESADYDDAWRVVAYVYEKMGGKRK